MTLDELIDYYFNKAQNPKSHKSNGLNTDTYLALQELEATRKALVLMANHWSDLEEVLEEQGINIKYNIYSPIPRERKVEVYLKKVVEE